MRLGVSLAVPQDTTATADYFVAGMKRVEAAGFDGLWFFDTVGRGNIRPDPLIMASVAATVTRNIILGTCIYQVPLRGAVELAHRLLTVRLLCGDRFVFGVGAGSTRKDFDAVGRDYEARFKALADALPRMRRLWNGETVDGAFLAPWPAAKGGPPILIGSWAGSRWIRRAAEDYDGWIASGHFTNLATMGEGIRRFRDLGGRRAVAANIRVDLAAPTTDLAGEPGFHLKCAPDAAAERLRQLAALGFDDVVLVVEDASEASLAAIRGLWKG